MRFFHIRSAITFLLTHHDSQSTPQEAAANAFDNGRRIPLKVQARLDDNRATYARTRVAVKDGAVTLGDDISRDEARRKGLS